MIWDANVFKKKNSRFASLPNKVTWLLTNQPFQLLEELGMKSYHCQRAKLALKIKGSVHFLASFPTAMWHRWSRSRVSDITPVAWQGQTEFFSRGASVHFAGMILAQWTHGPRKQHEGWGGQKKGKKKRRRKKKRRQKSATAPLQYLSQEQQTLFGDLRGCQPQSLFQAAGQGVDTWRTNQRISDSASHMMEQTNKTSPGSRPSHLSRPPPCPKATRSLWLLSNTPTATTSACVRVTDALVKKTRRAGRGGDGGGNGVSRKLPRRSNLSPREKSPRWSNIYRDAEPDLVSALRRACKLCLRSRRVPPSNRRRFTLAADGVGAHHLPW